ncbi:hypothetical protein BO70DRAFT_125307 [Aspergillus heteromorphus CBS 117.55]|uniref:Tr-type G domain-containing protein n=1 Tax=Aspergillus heteromorphus CBS 117.55 TaxID=1448321 RepID=A0A317V985_9EURO|nr:uncharacterized protein BO70DRAFT_125307 [Aspergillus heteromorphus CBS 117.55]PWY70944.1 hypothetical protein BO70DRAFT_125307 [Aspergillus heteromorphus CBS 117.55]
MASVFTYDPDPPRVSSPWSTTSGSSTPQTAAATTSTPTGRMVPRIRSNIHLDRADTDADHDHLSDYGITKLDPEPQEGPTEYKLHLLLRRRRPYVSMSTSHLVGGSYHSRASASVSASASLPTDCPTPPAASYDSTSRSQPPQQQQQQSRSTESRQQRLEHLTTQLLWRLQQSSPFHSSTAAANLNLVLPVLPDATSQAQLGSTPPKPPRLLPGLEESQGALYEVGVADDGMFVGLTRDELEESLGTLRVMAASLGCKVEVLRRVIVGECEWVGEDEGEVKSGSLWVAEALVSPDWEFYRVESPRRVMSEGEGGGKAGGEGLVSGSSDTGQIRVSIAGPSAAGKSSLLGTLTSSVLDNGRGTSRLGLLKHRHEISSGVTSSVAHELIGYAAAEAAEEEDRVEVINYASGNVAAWDDVHAASGGGRLAFVSDLPGSVRYLKSTLRGLISWAPHYVFLCIPATCGEGPAEAGHGAEQPADMKLVLSQLELCTKMDIPIVVVITKMDIAGSGLRSSLGKVLSAIKASGKKPEMIVSTGAGGNIQHVEPKDTDDVRKLVSRTQNWVDIVPIVTTSAVNGSGIGKLHALLRYLPIPVRPALRDVSLSKSLPASLPENVFDIDEVFAIPPSKVYSMSAEQQQKENHGVVLCGLVRYGAISAGDELLVGPLFTHDHGTPHRNRSERRSDTQQSSSYRSRPTSGDFSASLPGSLPGKAHLPIQAHWQRVRAVSVRNLRLPVQKLTQDQVGTIGVEPLPTTPDGEAPRLGKIRKGSILIKLPTPTPTPSSTLSSTLKPPPFHTGFTATFPAGEFASPLSPPVLLGGNAIIYVANVRTTVKLTCMALADDEVDVISRPLSPVEPDFFSFDGDAPAREGDQERGREREGVQDVIRAAGSNPAQGDIRITFEFVTSVEWVEVGSRVLLMPGASVALASTSGIASGVASGLEGFVGRVCEVVSSEGEVC